MEFVTKMGMTGYLTPQGEFHPCEYFQHIKFAERLYFIERSKGRKIDRRFMEGYDYSLCRAGYISMGSKGPNWNGMSHMRFPGMVCGDMDGLYGKPLTEEQVKWFEENMEKLDEFQEMQVRRYLYLYQEGEKEE